MGAHGAHSQALRSLLIGLQDLQVLPERPARRVPISATDKYLLFFDGGSRQNPGAGGSGAIIVRVDAVGGSPSIEWAAAMSLANDTTTNNQVEYFGLVTGLHIASTERLMPLTVIGDSAMIINQLRAHRAPKDEQLRRLYGLARVLADKLHVTEWHHHYRAFNKMADYTANLAMNTRRSIQQRRPTVHEHWSPLLAYVSSDGAPWQASTYQA